MRIRDIARGALIGALYVFLTVTAAPISSGLMQVRIAEALCVLPCFTPAAAPGLFVGCLLANLLTGAAPYDVIFGSLATLLAALLTRYLSRRGVSKWLMPLPAALCNALIVGWLLHAVYAVGVSFEICALSVALGELIAGYGLGMPLYGVLRAQKRFFQD